MECPCLSAALNRKICRLMVEQGLDAELDDFDVTHYCKGNPNHCFFFRSYSNKAQVTMHPEESALDVPIVPIGSLVLNQPIQPIQPSLKQSDKLLKLKRLLRRIT